MPFPGGGVFNTAIALGRLGVLAGHLTGLSPDEIGQMLRESLTRKTALAFLHLKEGQAESRVTYADVRYFNNNSKDTRAAHARRPDRYPSLEQCAQAFRLMPEAGEVARRNKAVFACVILAGARDGVLM